MAGKKTPRTFVKSVKAHDDLISTIHERLRSDTGARKAFSQLAEILVSLRDKETGAIAFDEPYLRTPTGKRALQHLIKTGFSSSISWPEAEMLLDRSQRTIEKAFSYHVLKRDHPKHLKWTMERIGIVKRRFPESQRIRFVEDLRKFREAVIKEVNDEPGQSVSWNAICCIARGQKPPLRWGMSDEEKRQHDSAVIRRICSDESRSDDEKRDALLTELRVRQKRYLYRCLTDCGFEDEAEKLKYPVGAKSTQQSVERDIKQLLAERIAAGDLTDPKVGAGKLFKRMCEEFAERIKEAGIAFEKADFPALLDEVIWNTKLLGLLTEVVQSDLPDPVDAFCRNNQNIPREMVEAKLRYRKGVTSRHSGHTSFIPGLGRLDLDEIDPEEVAKFRFPKASSSHPYQVDIADPAFTVNVVNGPNIGIAFDALDIERNASRRAFAESRIRGAKAIVMSGLFDLDLKKAAGPLKVHRALISGLRVNWEKLEVSYQPEAKHLLEERKNLSTKDTKLLYITIAERLELIVDAWHKITHRPKNRQKPTMGHIPEYDGPVIIIFGYKEEELITSAAYWEARYLTLQTQNNLRVEMKLAENRLARAIDAEDNEEIKNARVELERIRREYSRTINSDVSPEDLTRQFRRILPLVVKKFEAVIPNSKVIGLGTSYVRFGSTVVEFNVPDHTKPLADILAGYTKAYTGKVLRGKMADSVVILHPHSVSYRQIDRSRDAKGKRRSVLVHAAPITVDAEYLRKCFMQNPRQGTIIKKVHPISKLVFHDEFEPGILTLSINGDLRNGYATDIPALALHEETEKKQDGGWKHVHIPLWEDPVLRYINLITTTDLHYGSRNREQVFAPDLWRYVGCDEMFMLLMRRAGLLYSSRFPFHLLAMNDDGVQANHLRIWQQQPNPEEMPLWQIERKEREFKKRSDKARTLQNLRAILDEAARLNMRQFVLRPPDWFQNQLRILCHKYVDQNVDFFGSVLSKTLETKLIVRGSSYYEEKPHDSRDLGVINIGSGNHGTKGTGGEMTEGWIIADRIWLRLLGDPEREKWRDFSRTEGEDELRRLVTAPLYSNIFTAWGTVQVPGGYEWAFDLRSSPPKMKGWNNTLAGWVFVDPSRGNYARFYEKPESSVEENRIVVKTCGDKHFHAAARTSYVQYVMCAPNTHTDQFAEMAGGLPPNSTGITVTCLPKDGPRSGPIIVLFFPFEWLKYHTEHPEVVVDWGRILPNPL